MRPRNEQQKFAYYLKNRNYYLKTYWENNDGTNLYRPNGFDSLPENIYKAFAAEIDKNGKVLDLGCGNGLMLQYLMFSSGYKLIPYGVDFMESSIKQAKEILHPQYATHFVAGNVTNYSFDDKPFDFIFATIHHIHPDDRAKHLKKIREGCQKNGKVIFYEYADVLRAENYAWVGEFPEVKNWGLLRKNYSGVSLGIWKKR